MRVNVGLHMGAVKPVWAEELLQMGYNQRTTILLMVLDALEPLVGMRKLEVDGAVVDHGVAGPVV